MLDRKIVHVADVLADPEYTFLEGTGRIWFRTVLGVPLMREGNPLGVLVLARANVQPFSEKQIDLIQTFADQAVIAIENVRLFEEVQARNREVSEALQQQTATADVLKVISRSAFDLQPVLRTLIDSAARLCGARSSGIFMRDGGVSARSAATPTPRSSTSTRGHIPVRSAGSRGSGRAALDNAVVHVQDVSKDLGTRGPELAASRRLSRRCCACR